MYTDKSLAQTHVGRRANWGVVAAPAGGGRARDGDDRTQTSTSGVGCLSSTRRHSAGFTRGGQRARWLRPRKPRPSVNRVPPSAVLRPPAFGCVLRGWPPAPPLGTGHFLPVPRPAGLGASVPPAGSPLAASVPSRGCVVGASVPRSGLPACLFRRPGQRCSEACPVGRRREKDPMPLNWQVLWVDFSKNVRLMSFNRVGILGAFFFRSL